MKTTSGSISTGDQLIIEIDRGLSKGTKDVSPPRQLKTVPLTAAGLAAAQASAAALSQANSRDSRAPREAAKTGSVRPVTSDPARRRVSRGTTLTMLAIGALAVACSVAAWTQRSSRTVVTATAAATTEAPTTAATAAERDRQPPAAETAVGFVVAPRPPTPPEGATVEAKVEADAPVAAVPAAPPTGMAAAAPPPAVAPVELAAEPTARRHAPRPRVPAEPVAKSDPPPARPKAAEPAAPKPKAPEKTAAVEEKKPAPAPAAAPSSVDAILQQQLKSAIP